MQNRDQLIRESLAGLLREIVSGPPADVAFVLNRGDRGLLASLDALSAEAASARPGGRPSVAAHVDHLRYGLELLNRWSRGGNPWADANFAASWQRQEVSEDEWLTRRAALAREAQAWMDAVGQPREWDGSALSEMLGSVVHMAYHLGAIRQVAAAANGPKAHD